ncbi:MAG: TIGR00701 family protein [Rickettsiales bacterium]|nr:TIGR00701 family protein [Rickettsiales bacterium]|tara:strand:+ start:1395 stop:1841 length:447 start_codon:yes stop_codon:yes gene_type:complete
MQSVFLDYYLTIKALHIISFVSWMAGMFYLPRLYVYHTKTAVGSDGSEMFKVMERKLLKFIMNPAMIATFIFGLIMIYANPDLMSYGWMHAKITLVLIMAGLHGYLGYTRKQFDKDNRAKSEKFYRYLNEGPTVVFIAIVFLAILKPF